MDFKKEKIIEMAKTTYCSSTDDFDVGVKNKENKGDKGNKKNRISRAQIQTYMETVKNAEVFDEYLIFLEYQFNRLFPQLDVTKKIKSDIKEIYDMYSNNRWQDAIAYYFGTLKRLVHARWKCEGGDRK